MRVRLRRWVWISCSVIGLSFWTRGIRVGSVIPAALTGRTADARRPDPRPVSRQSLDGLGFGLRYFHSDRQTPAFPSPRPTATFFTRRAGVPRAMLRTVALVRATLNAELVNPRDMATSDSE